MTQDLNPLFNPSSVAIVGASSEKTKLSGRPVHFLKTHGFKGDIYPINPKSDEIQGLPAYPKVSDVPGHVDQAIILVPAKFVEDAVADCAKKGVKVVQILSSGFGEMGEEGRAAQSRLVEKAQQANMRLTGPNALGALSPGNGLFATFSSSMARGTPPPAGNVAFATQSGAFGSCAYVMAMQRGLGLSRVVATGNEADIDVAESISYLVDDPETKVICAAIENCTNGERMRAALRKAAQAKKPVVIMKVGTTELGAAAAATHTGALAGDDSVFDTVFSECGAWRAKSIEEMIDIAYLISVGGMPIDNRMSILTVSGGIGIVMADTAVDNGLAVDPLSDDLIEKLKEHVPFATGNNPFDTTAQIATRRTAITDVGADILTDAGYGTLVFYLGNNGLAPEVFRPSLDALVKLKSQFPDRIIITVMPTEAGVRAELEAAGIVVFEDPSRPVLAVAAAAKLQASWATVEEPSTAAIKPITVAENLSEASAKALLADVGFPVLDERVCTSAEAAGDAAEEMGFPIVAKILSPDILHKTEIGGVLLNLEDRAAVEEAFTGIMQRATDAFPNADIEGILLAPMIKDGVETILGVHRDPVFGPMIMFGFGGVMVELFKDVSFASAPVSPARAERLIDSIQGSKLLGGWRGDKPKDRAALVDAICRLSDLVVAADNIDGIDINPFVVREQGAVALDAVITTRS